MISNFSEQICLVDSTPTFQPEIEKDEFAEREHEIIQDMEL